MSLEQTLLDAAKNLRTVQIIPISNYDSVIIAAASSVQSSISRNEMIPVNTLTPYSLRKTIEENIADTYAQTARYCLHPVTLEPLDTE